MQYVRIRDAYIEYLKEYETRIPNQNYGKGHYKPFYILDNLKDDGNVIYVNQLTSPKVRHLRMSENIDFKKLLYPDGHLSGATNLNYMFPVLPEFIEPVSLHDIKAIVNENKAVNKLAIQRKILESRKDELQKNMDTIYRLKYEMPDSPLARRCLDYKNLETVMLQYKLQEMFYREDIQVARSQDHATFFVHVSQDTYTYSDNILHDMPNFLLDVCDKMQSNLNIDMNKDLHLG